MACRAMQKQIPSHFFQQKNFCVLRIPNGIYWATKRFPTMVPWNRNAYRIGTYRIGTRTLEILGGEAGKSQPGYSLWAQDKQQAPHL